MSIRKCNCRHEDQDKRYGEGYRVHNKAKSTIGIGSDWVCTVCKNRKVR